MVMKSHTLFFTLSKDNCDRANRKKIPSKLDPTTLFFEVRGVEHTTSVATGIFFSSYALVETVRCEEQDQLPRGAPRRTSQPEPNVKIFIVT